MTMFPAILAPCQTADPGRRPVSRERSEHQAERRPVPNGAAGTPHRPPLRERVREAGRLILGALALVLALLPGTALRADWVNLGGAEVAPNIAEIWVQDDGVRVVLEVFVGDLEIFSDLVPGEWMTGTGQQLRPDGERLKDFAVHGLSIHPDGGAALPLERVVVERRIRADRASPMAGQTDPYSGRKMPSPPEDPRVLYVELFYPFAAARPERIRIEPPLEESGSVAAVIGMAVFHHAVPVIDFRYLSAPATLDLDWDDPWYSRFDNPNLTRHHKYPRMTYLYAAPYEIRHEALVRVRDALELSGATADGATLDQTAAQSLAQSTADILGARTPMTIAGEAVTPDFDRAAFMRIGMRGLEFLQPGEAVDVNADILGLIWSVPTDGLPQQATLDWAWFDDEVVDVAGYAVDAAGPFLFPLTAEDPRITWTNHFKKDPYPKIAAVRVDAPTGAPRLLWLLAGGAVLGGGLAIVALLRRRAGWQRSVFAGVTVALICGAAVPVVQARQASRLPDLDPDALASLTSDLLNNVYRAFDFRTEDQVYDRLALTLEGDVLEQVYLDQRAALRIEQAGGADARVEALEVASVTQQETAEPGILRLRADWVVRGSVGHWGHVHSRMNGYEADLSVIPVDGSWKIRDFDVLSQERLP